MTLERIRHSGRLRYGSDMEGGGPYAYPDPRSPREVTGFEVELMARLAKDLGVTAEFSQGQWDKLLQVLDAGRIDLVCNGYEWTETRARDYLATRPYYVYQLQLMARRGSAIRSWADLKQPEAGRRPLDGRGAGRVGGRYVRGRARRSARRGRPVRRGDRRHDGRSERPVRRDPARPARRHAFIASRFPGLELVGPPESHGYYVLYVRERRRAAARRARPRPCPADRVGRAAADLRKVRDLDRRPDGAGDDRRAARAVVTGRRAPSGWALLRQYQSRLFDAAFVTIALSVTSMPLAMATRPVDRARAGSMGRGRCDACSPATSS